jgi:hypothetical protein
MKPPKMKECSHYMFSSVAIPGSCHGRVSPPLEEIETTSTQGDRSDLEKKIRGPIPRDLGATAAIDTTWKSGP